mgnify:CR=1 FL=1
MTEKKFEELHGEFIVKRIGEIGIKYCDRINQAKSDKEATYEFCGAMCAVYNKGLLDGMHAGECGKLDYSEEYWNEN